jgi:hypothetical protein
MALLQKQEGGREAKRTLKKKYTRKQRKAAGAERQMRENWQYWTGGERMGHMKKVAAANKRFGQRAGMYREATMDERAWLKKKFRKSKYRKDPSRLRPKFERRKRKRRPGAQPAGRTQILVRPASYVRS